MYSVYLPARKVLEWVYDLIQKDKYFLYLFLVATDYDDVVLDECIEYSNDLDKLTGKRCLFLVFFNTEPESDTDLHLNSRRNGQRLLYQPFSLSDIKEFKIAMTKESYRFADCLGIRYENLPCLVAISSDDPSSIGLLRLSQKSLSGHYDDIRRIVAEFYKTNSEFFSQLSNIESIEKAIDSPSFENSGHYAEKRLLNKYLIDEVIPMIDACIKNRNPKHILSKKLYITPRDWTKWSRFLNKVGDIEIKGIEVNSKNPKYGLIKIGKLILSEKKAELVNEKPKFSVDLISKIDRRNNLKQALDRFLDRGKKVTSGAGFLKWFS